jgi:V8-like Glu-specific endopeptidase
MERRGSRWAGGLALALVLSLSLAASASAHRVALAHVSVAKQQGGDGPGYWTAKRRAEARPAPLPTLSAKRARSVAAQSAAEPQGRPKVVEPSRPRGAHRLATPVTDPSQFPYSTGGLVLFDMGRFSYGCSGTVIDAKNRSVVFTAGHCVYDGGRGPWAKHWSFAPGYQDGVAPYGYFRARELWSTRQWIRSGNFSYDFGAAVLRPNRSGQRVEDVAGARGIAFNQDRHQTYDAFGYPGEAPFDGEHMEECLSPFLANDTGLLPPFSILCDMTEGASGGGWIIDNAYENGLTSYGYTQQPDVLYSPYFGNAPKKLWQRVAKR